MRAEDLDALHCLRRHLAMPSVLRPLHRAWLRRRQPSRAAALEALLALADGPEARHLDTAAHAALREDHAPPAPPQAPPGDRLGPWRLDGLLGAGGMGSVFLAHRDDGAYRQQVAIKRMHAGTGAATLTDAFLREREILARLNHPGISRLIDGGIDACGRPWLAMELIDGEPIDRWCDRQRLSIRARATLLLQVCDAVHHAHRYGIVHGDLKPANLLVNADGFAKLLDFGVASLIDDASAETAPAIGLTEAYASPARLAHAPASGSDDIYALGAVLCRLVLDAPPAAQPVSMLCGLLSPDAPVFATLPAADTLSPAALRARRLRDADALKRQLRPELEAILSRCLAPLPQHRYADAAELAADLRAWLQHAPVAAMDGGLLYRIGCHLRSHRIATAVIGLAVVLLGATLAMQWRDRQRERSALAALDFALEDSVATTAMSGLGDPGLTPRMQLQRTEANLRAARTPDDGALRAYGLLALARSHAGIGDYAHALALAAEARALGGHDAVVDARAAVLRATVLNLQGRHAEAEAVVRQALAMRAVLERAPAGLPARIALSTEAAESLWQRGRQAEALAQIGAQIAAARTLHGEAARLLPELLTRRAQWRTALYATDAAQRDLDEAIALGTPRFPHTVDSARLARVRTLLRMNRQQDAKALADRVLDAFEARYGPRHPETARALLVRSEAIMQSLNLEDDDLRGVIADARRAGAILSGSLGRRDPYYTESLKYTAYARAMLGEGDREAILAEARDSLRLLESAPGATLDQRISAKVTLADILSEFSLDPRDEGRMLKEALGLYADVAQETAARGIPIPHVLSIYARALYDAGDRPGARRALLRADAEIRRCLGPDHAYLVFNHLQLARMALDDGDEATATPSLDEILRITAQGTGGASTVALARFGALYMRADIDEHQGHPDDARARLTEAITLGTAIHGGRDDPKLRDLRRRLARLEAARRPLPATASAMR
jgi:serine/threonine-protein kinase